MRMSRARTWSIAIAAMLASIVVVNVGVAFADAPPAAPGPDLAQRVADLEAYVTNGAPKALTTTSGPGHNAWMMTSTALVLFMTLPGLALFYGGLVRSRNALSVLLHCVAAYPTPAPRWCSIAPRFRPPRRRHCGTTS